jgi:nitrile hydratase
VTGFSVGEQVRVCRGDPPGHIRTPFYARGKLGVVERICGQFRNPEELAYGRWVGPKGTLYRVRFNQRALWPDYRGQPADTVDIEIFEHWLEQA